MTGLKIGMQKCEKDRSHTSSMSSRVNRDTIKPLWTIGGDTLDCRIINAKWTFIPFLQNDEIQRSVLEKLFSLLKELNISWLGLLLINLTFWSHLTIKGSNFRVNLKFSIAYHRNCKIKWSSYMTHILCYIYNIIFR